MRFHFSTQSMCNKLVFSSTQFMMFVSFRNTCFSSNNHPQPHVFLVPNQCSDYSCTLELLSHMKSLVLAQLYSYAQCIFNDLFF